MMKQPVVFSFFAGPGFLDLGFEDSGYEVHFVSELHPPFMRAYHYFRQALNKASPRYGYHEGDVSSFLEGKCKRELEEFIRDSRRRATVTGFIGGPVDAGAW